MTKLSYHTVDALKSEGHYFAAGAVAKALGCGPYYGAHAGMRSTFESARNEFYRGYNAETGK
jgi:hypothetical protein